MVYCTVYFERHQECLASEAILSPPHSLPRLDNVWNLQIWDPFDFDLGRSLGSAWLGTLTTFILIGVVIFFSVSLLSSSLVVVSVSAISFHIVAESDCYRGP